MFSCNFHSGRRVKSRHHCCHSFSSNIQNESDVHKKPLLNDVSWNKNIWNTFRDSFLSNGCRDSTSTGVSRPAYIKDQQWNNACMSLNWNDFPPPLRTNYWFFYCEGNTYYKCFNTLNIWSLKASDDKDSDNFYQV